MRRYGYYHEREDQKNVPVIVIALILLAAAIIFSVIFTKDACSRPEKKFLVVGTNTPFPPFEFKRGEDVVGFDIDMAKEIAKALGKKLIVKDFTEFDALLPAVRSGSLDMAASSITIRQDRDEVIDFSTSYYLASQGVLARRGGKQTQGRPGDFAGLKIGYQEGTTSEFWIEDNLAGKIAVAGNTSFDDMNLGLQLLRLGSVDAIILDAPAAKNFAKLNPDLMFAGTIETGEKYGFVVEQNDPKKFLPAINKVIAEMKNDGRYQKLLEKWFGGEK